MGGKCDESQTVMGVPVCLRAKSRKTSVKYLASNVKYNHISM